MLLQNKRILLGVTGSISAYKACDLARLFVKAGATVRVVMSESATRFISPLTFEALTKNSVLTNATESWGSSLNHIDISKECDIFVIAPATANTINKLSKGIADTLLTQVALACKAPIVIAPAANTTMLENHYTQGSIKMLGVNDITFVKPQNKLLACGDSGNGALAEPSEIFWESARVLLRNEFWSNRRVVVTGGGTRELIDEVRFISNFSSGKMANAMATALYLRGADVCLITTKDSSDNPQNIYTIDVESANEMLEFVTDSIRVAKKGVMSKPSLNNPDALGVIQKEPYLFMAAAVSDYTPSFPQTGKLKKVDLGDKWAIELKQTTDILATINKDGIKTVAFKAEMNRVNGLNSAISLLEQKSVDAVCYNLLDGSQDFGTQTNSITWITDKEQKDLGKLDKLDLAFKILDNAEQL
jgi:phosphopantothenoylcysteine decarboxylase/phosphopantothenate--cysteine ligase